MIDPDLQHYIENEILPLYQHFDKAHTISHAETVISESLKLAAIYHADPNMAYTIAAYHDTGLCKDRETHHLISGEILQSDIRLRQWFTEEQILIMKEAVEDHRASSDHEPRSLYGKIVAEADRIIDPEITLRRTVQYGIRKHPDTSAEWQYQRFREHLTKKYAESGYLKLWLEGTKNSENLKKLREILRDETVLKETFYRMHREETEDN
ncbi:MAG: HD domain-containing protein [Bacteroides sp.]|nr:HD domain-containing protein [Bacteroides sp.]